MNDLIFPSYFKSCKIIQELYKKKDATRCRLDKALASKLFILLNIFGYSCNLLSRFDCFAQHTSFENYNLQASFVANRFHTEYNHVKMSRNSSVYLSVAVTHVWTLNFCRYNSERLVIAINRVSGFSNAKTGTLVPANNVSHESSLNKASNSEMVCSMQWISSEMEINGDKFKEL